MRSFDTLTRPGQYRRLRRLAFAALEDYGFAPALVRFLTEESNVIFRIDTRDGGKYALRIYAEDAWSTAGESELEMFWLRAILRDTDLPVCEPVPRTDGELITFARADGVPGSRRCALFKWVPGHQLDAVITPLTYGRLGAVMAGLHNHAETLTLPEHIRPRRWDRVFYYADEPVVYARPEYRHLFDAAQVRAIDRFCGVADAYLDDLYRQGVPMLIHGDMHGWNVLVHSDRPTVIDFEDALSGYPVQDIANSLYYFRQRSDFPALKTAFETAYAAIRPLPQFTEHDLDVLWGARMTMFMNYVAHHGYEDGGEKAFIDSRCEMLDGILARLA